MDVVLVRLLGGLANQIFQYALGRATAIRTGALLRFDTRDLDSDTLRDYALDQLNVRGRRASLAELDYFLNAGARDVTVVRENSFEFDPAVQLVRAPVYLDGYWQSERYFYDCAAVLRNDISLARPFTRIGEELAARMDDSVSVSVHVRRGDYISNSRTNAYHGAVSKEYINSAIRHIDTQYPGSVFFIFSDDLDWARDNLDAEGRAVFVTDRPDASDAEDLILMGRCKHHILSNSSFSWWGAWLNPSLRKTVVAPSPWFAEQSLNTRDLYGPEWIRLSIKSGEPYG